MKDYIRKAQSGQVIILMALGMIALLAVLGLAIDGGRLYYLERNGQNAVDSAVIAAAYSLCTGGNLAAIEHAAIEAAASNGFRPGGPGVVNFSVNNPPVAGTGAGDNRYVEVILEADIPSYFIQLVYQGAMSISTRALAKCEPSTTSTTSNTYAVFAGSQNCRYAIDWSGSDIVILGDIHSNYQLDNTGSNHSVCGIVTYVDKFHNTGSGHKWNQGYPQPGSVQPYYPVNFNITDYAPGGVVGSTIPSSQYFYYDACDDLDDYWDLDEYWKGVVQDGLYYSECGMRISGSGFSGEITLVARGEIKISGSNFNFNSYVDDLFLYSDYMHSTSVRQCNIYVIKLSGSSYRWIGLIYAPNGLIDISGSGYASGRGSIIGYRVELSGSHWQFGYSPGAASVVPASISMVE